MKTIKLTSRTTMVTAVVAAALIAPAVARGQYVISDGNVRWTYKNITGTSAVVNLEVPLGLDHAAEQWWWYRLADDLQETIFPPPDYGDYGGNTLHLYWENVDGRGFWAHLDGSIWNIDGAAHLILNLTVGPVAGNLEITIFSYLDLDLSGTSSNDYGTHLSSEPLIEVTDSGGVDIGTFAGPRADGWETDVFPNLRWRLNNTNQGDWLCNCCNLNCGPWGFDWTGAFQWSDRVIPSGCSDRFMTLITINQAFDGCSGGAGDCCSANGSAGCTNVACCQIVGACDSYCLTDWDSACAGTGFGDTGCGAELLCDSCRGPTCWEGQDCSIFDECSVPCCDPGAPGADSQGCLYTYRSRPYGDVYPYTGITPPCNSVDKASMGDGFANMLDVFCAFNAFNDGSPYWACPCADVSPCGGDGFVNMLDVYAIFSAFNDSPLCSAPCG